MFRRLKIILVLGVAGLVFLVKPTVVFGVGNKNGEAIEKSLFNHYGGTSEMELEHILSHQDIKKFTLANSIKFCLRQAVNQGLPLATILILFCLPLIGTLSDVLHYMVGLVGYGIYIPTMVAASFWSIGIVGGLVLFLFILGLSLVARNLLYKVKLHYWPRRSITLWMVVLGVFVAISLVGGYVMPDLSYLSAFSILFLILFVEEHISTQRRKNAREAMTRTLATIILAIILTLFLSWYPFQKLVLLHPELFLLAVLGLGIAVGRYTGFRLLEFKRFKSALRKEE